MLAPEVRLEGWDVLDWVRLLSLFEGSLGSSTVLFVLHDGKVIRKLLHAKAGRLEPGGQLWGGPLDELARTHAADRVVGLRLGALEEWMERLGARLVRADDLLSQIWKGFDVLRELAEEGSIVTWPGRIRDWTLPSLSVVRQGLDVLCPSGKVIALGLFEQGELWTSLAISRQPQGLDRIVGPEALRGAVGLLSGDFRRDYWHVKRAIQNQVGPLYVGLFTEVSTLRRLISEGRPGSWARAVAVRDVILAPNPAAFVLPLGVDAVRGLTQSVLRATARLRIEERLALAVATVRSPESRRNPWHALRDLLEKLAD